MVALSSPYRMGVIVISRDLLPNLIWLSADQAESSSCRWEEKKSMRAFVVPSCCHHLLLIYSTSTDPRFHGICLQTPSTKINLEFEYRYHLQAPALRSFLRAPVPLLSVLVLVFPYLPVSFHKGRSINICPFELSSPPPIPKTGCHFTNHGDFQPHRPRL